MSRLAVLGGGSWGTALAVHAVRAGLPAALWTRRPALAEAVRRERRNEAYLPGVELPEGLEVTSEMAAVAAAQTVLVVVPSHGFRAVVRDLLAARRSSEPLVLVSATKGIETDSLARMSQVAFEEAVAADVDVRFAVLSGPTFAVELAAGQPTAAVVASDEASLAADLQQLLATPVLRLYTSQDVVGVELGGAAKNVIAIAAGVVTGLGLGHNTLAALITRGLHEITRLGIAYGGQPRTFSGLAGLGDLVLTCTGGLSRNRRTGLELARGRTLEEVRGDTPMVAEGVRNALSTSRLAERKGVELPITMEMVRVLYEGESPRRAVEILMRRELKAEGEL